MEHDCNWCRKLARLYYDTPKGVRVWYCPEHYDNMVAHYKGRQWDNEFCREMVELNGW